MAKFLLGSRALGGRKKKKETKKHEKWKFFLVVSDSFP